MHYGPFIKDIAALVQQLADLQFGAIRELSVTLPPA
jgi:hypothetical protein